VRVSLVLTQLIFFLGVQRADSVTWNPHKLMGVILQCSALLVKHKGMLSACNNMSAEYLFQPDKHYDVRYDTGDKTIQCGRRPDAFKLWLGWKAKVILQKLIDPPLKIQTCYQES